MPLELHIIVDVLKILYMYRLIKNPVSSLRKLATLTLYLRIKFASTNFNPSVHQTL
jgi:hypothetical protein